MGCYTAGRSYQWGDRTEVETRGWLVVVGEAECVYTGLHSTVCPQEEGGGRGSRGRDEEFTRHHQLPLIPLKARRAPEVIDWRPVFTRTIAHLVGVHSQIRHHLEDAFFFDTRLGYSSPVSHGCKPWGSFAESIREAMIREIHGNPEIGIRYGLSEDDTS